MRSVYSIDELSDLARDLKNYEDEVEKKTKTLLHRLAEEGVDDATVRFEYAIYAGTNDVRVEFEEVNDKTIAVVAIGRAVLFIEFGTGTVVYPDDHPDKPSDLIPRGKYGKGQGSRDDGWRYYGEQGNEPMTRVVRSNEKGELIHTYGNPANASLYLTREELKRRLITIAREVFHD